MNVNSSIGFNFHLTYYIICRENQDCKKNCTFFWEIFCSSLVAYRHVVLGVVLICFAVSFFLLMAYRHVIRRIYFLLLREFILTHALHRRPACCSCTLNVSCFRKSLVVYAHRARPRLPSCKGLRSKECPMCRMKRRSATTEQQQTAKQATSNAQTKMAIRPCRVTTVCKSNNIQCAD